MKYKEKKGHLVKDFFWKAVTKREGRTKFTLHADCFFYFFEKSVAILILGYLLYFHIIESWWFDLEHFFHFERGNMHSSPWNGSPHCEINSYIAPILRLNQIKMLKVTTCLAHKARAHMHLHHVYNISSSMRAPRYGLGSRKICPARATKMAICAKLLRHTFFLLLSTFTSDCYHNKAASIWMQFLESRQIDIRSKWITAVTAGQDGKLCKNKAGTKIGWQVIAFASWSLSSCLLLVQKTLLLQVGHNLPCHGRWRGTNSILWPYLYL